MARSRSAMRTSACPVSNSRSLPLLPAIVPLALKLYIVDWKHGGSFSITPTT